jgi:hypothetical protein
MGQMIKDLQYKIWSKSLWWFSSYETHSIKIRFNYLQNRKTYEKVYWVPNMFFFLFNVCPKHFSLP